MTRVRPSFRPATLTQTCSESYVFHRLSRRRATQGLGPRHVSSCWSPLLEVAINRIAVGTLHRARPVTLRLHPGATPPSWHTRSRLRRACSCSTSPARSRSAILLGGRCCRFAARHGRDSSRRRRCCGWPACWPATPLVVAALVGRSASRSRSRSPRRVIALVVASARQGPRPRDRRSASRSWPCRCSCTRSPCSAQGSCGPTTAFDGARRRASRAPASSALCLAALDLAVHVRAAAVRARGDATGAGRVRDGDRGGRRDPRAHVVP